MSMRCPFNGFKECNNECALLVTVCNGRSAVCGLIADSIVNFVGNPVTPMNWVQVDLPNVTAMSDGARKIFERMLDGQTT